MLVKIMSELKPLVVDLSAYQPNVDFHKMAAAGIIGCIHKATQGRRWVDSWYAKHRSAALAAGMLWGAYHFFDFTGTPAEQADHFLAVADADKDTLVCLDWENVPPSNMEPTSAQAKAFLMEIEAKLGRKALLYGGNVPKEQIRGVDAYFASHRLWLCQYASHFTTQASWKNQPWLWQNNGDSYGPGPHHLPGYPGLCDNSCIVGDMTVERLKTEWAG